MSFGIVKMTRVNLTFVGNRYTMNAIFVRNGVCALSLPRILSTRLLASRAQENEKDKPDVDILQEDTYILDPINGLTEEEIEAKRNKSRLRTAHRNVLHGVAPERINLFKYEDSVRYRRRILGKYGMASMDVPIGIAWPTREEVEEKKQYEGLLYPETLEQEWEKIAVQKAAEAKARLERDEQVTANMQKLDKWKADLAAKITKKENELAAARERKERLIEEVRRHFGFTVDPRDQRFKDMMEQKEKEEKKIKKMAKKQAREAKMMSFILQAQTDSAKRSSGSTDTTKQQATEVPEVGKKSE